MVGDDESNVVASSNDAEAITTELLGKLDPPLVSKPATLENEAKLARKLLKETLLVSTKTDP
jgi:hypothetical protein